MTDRWEVLYSETNGPVTKETAKLKVDGGFLYRETAKYYYESGMTVPSCSISVSLAFVPDIKVEK